MMKPEYTITADNNQLDAATIDDSYIKAVNITRNINANAPIDVAVSETDSHEIENLKKAMKKCDDQWAEKYSELEENTVLHERELHQNYKAQIDKLTADYEKKLAEISTPEKSEQVSIPDMKETFKAYYSVVYNSFVSLINFVKKQNSEDKTFCKEKTQKLIEIMKQTEV